jgi:hypothetical protein
VHEFELGDLEMVQGFVPLPNTSTSVEDRLFVGVEELEGGSNPSELVVV